MGEYEVKLGAALKFDSEKEKDIIEKLENLSSRRKLSEFMVNLIRVAFDNPEMLRLTNNKMNEYGLTEEREQFFKGIESEVSKMKYKIDKIFEMTMTVSMLAQFGKRIGLEGKAKNLMQADFILQRQTDELCSILGVSNLGHIYESNKQEVMMTKADEVLNYIIDTYDNIVGELKANILSATHMINASGRLNENLTNNISNNAQYTNTNNSSKGAEIGSTTKKEQSDNSSDQDKIIEDSQNKNSELTPNNEGVNDDEKIIDFGEGADYSALNKFIGA